MSLRALPLRLHRHCAAIGLVNMGEPTNHMVGSLKLAVFVDRLAPEQGAFAFAIDWARRLQGELQLLVMRPEDDSKARACAEVCQQNGSICELRAADRRIEGNPARTDTGTLFLIGHCLTMPQKAMVLQHVLPQLRSGVLVCPDQWQPVTRVLLIHQECDGDQVMLARGVRLCVRLGARPIVLTVARSERFARQLQEAARKCLNNAGLFADFDYLVGAEIRHEALSVARWRRCQLVVLPRPKTSLWQRWTRGNALKRMMESRNSFGVLTLPELDVPGCQPDADRPTIAAKPLIQSVPH